MLRINNLVSILALMALFACIKPYDPLIESNATNKFVVSGMVTSTEGWQEVEVSFSSPYEVPEYIPVSGCAIEIMDDHANVFSLDEYKPGRYRVWMTQEYLMPGTSYKVRVFTPTGEELVSGFDQMFNGPELDSVHYSLEDLPTTNPEVYMRVMQFYVDLNAVGNYSPYYKWDVIETWEHHAAHPKEYYYDGDWHQIDPPDSTALVCWSNVFVRNVFTLSTRNLSQNTYQKYPLHMIDGHSSRLGILYSILIRQLALSEDAYNYWERLRVNSNEQGGLYEKQPLAIKGNVLNMTHPENEVLGYFYAAGESAKRYFYKDIEGLELDFTNFCYEEGLGRFGWKEFRPANYPVYYYYTDLGALRILNNECVDCRLNGGTITKPDFWP